MFEYKTHGTCSTQIDLEIEDGVITACTIHNGCRGNTAGLAKMVVGRKADDVKELLRGIPCRLGKARNMSDFLSFLGVRHSLTPFYSQIFHVFHISFLHCLCYIIGVDFSASAHGAPGISRYRRSVYGKANGTKRRELYAQARPLHRR